MRLIDADALKENVFFHEVDNVSYVEEEDIDKAPTVDAVQVVRCKDCKHWDDVPADEKTQDHECHLFDGNEEKLRIATPSYWFCPMGERRSE
jgi:hypothetical protein